MNLALLQMIWINSELCNNRLDLAEQRTTLLIVGWCC